MSPTARLIQRLHRAGLHLARAERAIWVHGGTSDDFGAAAELIRALRRALPASPLLLTAADPRTCAWLRSRYPGHQAVPPPARSAAGRFFTAFDPILLVWLGFDDGLPRAALRLARERGLPIVAVEGRGGEPPDSRARHLAEVVPLLDRCGAASPESAERLRSLGAAGVVVTGPFGGVRSDASGPPPSFAWIEPLLGRLPGRPEGDFHAGRRMRRLAATRVGGWIAANRGTRRIDDWESLRERLGHPASILCLGNGPSSEDPAVRGAAHDCLMRVNHRWRRRGLLTRPDMVFAGDLRTTLELSGCVFGFRVVAKEREVLLRHLLFGRRLDRIEHFTLERVPSLLDERTWRANPTNGAVMIATAVMLRPRRLVIAGIDLFDDPRGSYPDAPLAENDYLPGHEREVDLEVISHALARFDGEVEILSPALARALRERASLPGGMA